MAKTHLLLLLAGAGLLAGAAEPLITNASATSCPSKSCGAVEIRYPLWLEDGGSGDAHSCGYEALRVQCRGGDAPPLLALPSGLYGVNQVNYGERTIRIFDLAATAAACPDLAGRNLTLPPGSPAPLELTARNGNLTFFLGCSFSGLASDHVLPCLDNGRRNHSYFFRDGHAPSYHYAVLCQEVVFTPVLHSKVKDISLALKDGFELTWAPAVAADCARCEASGGRCGQRRDTAAFVCLRTSAADVPAAAPSSSATASSDHSKKTASSAKILKVVAAILAILLILLAVVVAASYLRRRRREESTGDVNSIYSLGLPSLHNVE